MNRPLMDGHPRYETYLIPGKRGERLGKVLDMRHIYIKVYFVLNGDKCSTSFRKMNWKSAHPNMEFCWWMDSVGGCVTRG